MLHLLPAPRVLERREGVGPHVGTKPEVARDPSLPAQGYQLEIDPEGVRIGHADEAGLRYARATARQVAEQSAHTLPCLRIRDWPDFAVRGYMLDISRDRVPTRATLARIVELMERLRLNQLQLYTEHTFAYTDHEEVWRDASPMTPDDVRWLDAECAERGIELVANQNGFGHMERWLRHARYRPLAECPDGWRPPWGGRGKPGVLAPTDESLELVLGLYRELLGCFRSRRVNIGCDETWELGQGRSRDACAERGAGRVYLEFVERLFRALHAQDREVLFWGDILERHPDLVPELPRRDTIALLWGYEAPSDPASLDPRLAQWLERFGRGRESVAGFSAQVEPFAACGLPFWVCPGTSSWNSLVGRLPNASANLRDAARVGLANGASGFLVTDWGDHGHLQPPSVSFLPLALGAACAWCADSNPDAQVAAALDRLGFEDDSGRLSAALIALGAAYAEPGPEIPNTSPLLRGLLGDGQLAGAPGASVSQARIERTLARIEEGRSHLDAARPRCADGAIVLRELHTAARLARHGAWRLARAADLRRPSDDELRRDLAEAIDEQAACWLERSRPGGLRDSLGPLRKTLESYGDR